MTYEYEAGTPDRNKYVAERINELLANEFRIDPDDFIVFADDEGITVEFGAGKGEME